MSSRSVRYELQALQVKNHKLKEELQGLPGQKLESAQELVCVKEGNPHIAKELDEETTGGASHWGSFSNSWRAKVEAVA